MGTRPNTLASITLLFTVAAACTRDPVASSTDASGDTYSELGAAEDTGVDTGATGSAVEDAQPAEATEAEEVVGPADVVVPPKDTAPPPCAKTAAAVAKVKFYFVIHTEEDDTGCEPSSSAIPDFNGHKGTFDHFADAWFDYAVMLQGEEATLSFQTDWTFAEGVEKFRPSYFADLLALGNVEIVPHAHESCVAYDELYERLVALGAKPPKIIAGMTFDDYLQRGDWFAANPGWAFWNGPFGTPNHTDDASTPPFAYRIRPPAEVTTVTDLYTHAASSPLVVMPGLPWNADAMRVKRAKGSYVASSWFFLADRWFLADPATTTVPLPWRKKPGLPTGATPGSAANMSASELTAWIRDLIRTSYAPMVAAGELEFAQVTDVLGVYHAHEACLDLTDGQDLSAFVSP